jgi:hypothetical protein
MPTRPLPSKASESSSGVAAGKSYGRSGSWSRSVMGGSFGSGVLVAVGVGVLVAVAVDLALAVAMAVDAATLSGLGVAVAVGVAVDVDVGVGVGVELPCCGSSLGCGLSAARGPALVEPPPPRPPPPPPRLHGFR